TGMEYKQEGLSVYIKPVIITYLEKYDDLDDLVRSIKEDSTNKYNPELKRIVYGDNQKGFMELVHILADKFHVTTAEVASGFNTPAAEKYLELGHSLLDVVKDSSSKRGGLVRALSYHLNLSTLSTLIKEGADVNFSTRGDYVSSFSSPR